MFPVQGLLYQALKRLIKNHNSYLYLTGWMQSLEAIETINKDGNTITWMNYPVVKLLEEKLTRDLILFEYGSGYSTFFYADKVKAVVSVEHDVKWFRMIHKQISGNVNLIF